MQTQEIISGISNNLINLNLGSSRRESNLIQIEPMPWEKTKECLSLEFRHIYTSRLKKLEKRFPGLKNVSQISEISDENQRFIKGVVKRLEKSRVRAFQKTFHEKYDNDNPIYSAEDQIQIEDLSGKIKLKFKQNCKMNGKKIDATELPYGVVVGMRGRFKIKANRFYVDEIYTPEKAEQKAIKIDYITSSNVQMKHKKILVASQPSQQSCQNLVRILTDHSANSYVSEIVGLIIIGGVEMNASYLQKMDEIMCELKDSIDVFLIPSTNQSRNHLYPLNPYSPLFFKESKDQIGICSNPQVFTLENNVKMYISCGQNAKNFIKNCNTTSTLSAMKSMVEYSHSAPTLPFSLKTLPFVQDYFVMEELPHIFVCGKGSKYESQIIKSMNKQCLIVSIPEGAISVIDLNSLESKQFSTQMMRQE